MTVGGSLPKDSHLFLGMVEVGFNLGSGELATSVSRRVGFLDIPLSSNKYMDA